MTKPAASPRVTLLSPMFLGRVIGTLAAAWVAGCSGSDERVDLYPRGSDPRSATPTPARPNPPPVTASAPPPPPPKPNEAALAVPKCAPAFLNSVKGPAADSPAEAACMLIHRSFSDAKDTIVKGCNAGDAATCTLLGSMMGQTEWFGAELDVFVPPCHAKDRCWARYANGGTTLFAAASLDATDAIAALDKACSLGGPAACEALSVALFARAEAKAPDVAKKACDLGRGLDCRMLVERALKAKDTLDAATLKSVVATESKACADGAAESCLLLETLDEVGWANESDVGTKSSLLRNACDHHLGVACAKRMFDHVAGTTILSGSELSSVERELEKGCTSDRALVCAALGTAVSKGLGVAQDSDRGQHLLNDACNHRAVDCTELPQ